MTIETCLAEIRARVENATEGPWDHYSINPRITPEHSVYSVPLDADPLARVSEIAGPVEARDAEFIAHSRTDLPALLAAVEAVLELHTTGGACPDCGAGPSTVCECGPADCQGCTEAWPCPTVQAITTALTQDTTREDPS